MGPDDIDAESPFTLPGFFDAMADGRLLAAVCADCGTHLLPPRPACYDCGSRAVGIEEQPRTGTVESYTVVYRPPSAFADLAPFPVAVVELDSGARLTGRVDADLEDIAIGSTVELDVRDPATEGIDPEAALSYEADWPLHVFELV
ncbi:MAG: Zn-ribbon domain-containing OB-fold protein [Haloarculaceae archaeon]